MIMIDDPRAETKPLRSPHHDIRVRHKFQDKINSERCSQ
jgi:hypothetical protein